MNKRVTHIANETIPEASGNVLVTCEGACTTTDIIEAVIQADSLGSEYVKDFIWALFPKHNSFRGTCQEVWKLLRSFKYVADPEEFQDVQLPNALNTSKRGDCKSFSNFAASCLQALGVPYKYRFSNYTKRHGKHAKHVYVIAQLEDEEIIIDGVWHRFNGEKGYNWVQDYTPKGKKIDMSRVAIISGTNRIAGYGDLIPSLAHVWEGDDDSIYHFLAAKAWLNRYVFWGDEQRCEKEGLIVLNSWYDKDKKTANRGVLDDRSIERLNDYFYLLYKKQRTLTKSSKKYMGKVYQFFQTIDHKAEYAPLSFLYLFINSEKLLNEVPAIVRSKRAAQQATTLDIIEITKITSKDWLSYLRRRIISINRFNNPTPEALIASMAKGERKWTIEGIGEPATLTATVILVTKLIAALAALAGTIKAIFGQEPVKLQASGIPNSNDFPQTNPINTNSPIYTADPNQYGNTETSNGNNILLFGGLAAMAFALTSEE